MNITFRDLYRLQEDREGTTLKPLGKVNLWNLPGTVAACLGAARERLCSRYQAGFIVHIHSA
jgi:hypothetical protein